MKKKLIAILLAFNMVMMSACGASGSADTPAAGSESGDEGAGSHYDEASEIKSDLTSLKPDPGTGWIDSDIKEYYTAYPDVQLKDDFAAAVNKELHQTKTIDGTALLECMKEVLVRKRELLNDSSVTGKGIEEVRKFVTLAEDVETRNALGVEPLRPYISAIENISNTDELYAWITDIYANPLGAAPISVAGMARSEVDPDSYFVSISKPSLLLGSDDAYYSVGASSLEQMVKIEEKSEKVLLRLGYDDDAISDIIHKCLRFEKAMTGLEKDLTGEDEEDVTFTKEEIEFIQGDYPMITYLDNWGFGNCHCFKADSDYIKKLDNVCEKDLEEIKAMCILKYVLTCGEYLDEETADFFRESSKPRGVIEKSERKTEEELHEELIFKEYLGSTSLEGALDAAYVDKYIDPDSYDRLYGMTEEIIDEFRTLFASEKWLSEEGRAACLEKLDEIKIHVVYQDEADYSGLNIRSAEEGGNFLESYFEVDRFGTMKIAAASSKEVDRSKWSPYNPGLSTTETNAYYDPGSNGIYILAGILNDPAFTPDMTDEEMLSGIGVIVGHEITHGFDANGVKFDKDGIQQKWLPEDDGKAFEDATAKLAMFYLTLKPYTGSGPYNGAMVQTEAVADMGGMKVALRMGSKRPGFDYDAFFRHYANVWATRRSLDEEEAYVSSDPHPLAFYRINVVVSQFDEFLNTYGVKEGDGMYVNPDKRIAVW